MFKRVVDCLLIRSKFSTLTCFGTWLPSSGGREYLISYPSKVLCCGRVRVMGSLSGTYDPMRMANMCRNMSG
jgi:hypothetical protein